ncbi:MAG: hypothetical protein M0Q94_01690 [Candidatus Cloacimonetes bacterium]|nr:hypothetical protein [Candidatus Cloacimonadota bacterium]
MGRTAIIMVFVLLIIAGSIFVLLSEKQFNSIDSIVRENYSKQARHIANSFAHDAIRVLNCGEEEIEYNEELNISIIHQIDNQEILGIQNASVKVIMSENVYNNTLNAYGENISSSNLNDNFLEPGQTSITSTAKIRNSEGQIFEATTKLIYKQKPFSEYQLFIHEFPSGSYFTGIDEFDGPVYVKDEIRIAKDFPLSGFLYDMKDEYDGNSSNQSPVFNDLVTTSSSINNQTGDQLTNIFKGSVSENIPVQAFPEFNSSDIMQSSCFQCYQQSGYQMSNSQNFISLSGNKVKVGTSQNQNTNLQSVPEEGKLKKGNQTYDRVIFSDKDIHISGYIDFPLTVISNGNIYISGDITYGLNKNQIQDPRSNNNTQGLIGLIANKDIIIEATKENKESEEITVMAVMMTPNGTVKVNKNDIKRSVSNYDDVRIRWWLIFPYSAKDNYTNYNASINNPPFKNFKEINFIGSRIHKTLSSETFSVYSWGHGELLTKAVREDFRYRYNPNISWQFSLSEIWELIKNYTIDLIIRLIRWIFTGQFPSGESNIHGLMENNYFDPRLKDIAPPAMPSLPTGNIIMWEEIPVIVKAN